MDIYTSLKPNETLKVSQMTYVQQDTNTSARQIVVQASVQEPPRVLPEDSAQPSAVSPSMFIFPFLAWSILVGSLIMRFLSPEKAISTSTFHRSGYGRAATQNKQLIPCSRCHYFSSNAYVHCAIHPSKVSTAEATDCCDYRATAPR
jgi:hypothetical protein